MQPITHRCTRVLSVTALGAIAALSLSGCASEPALDQVWPEVRANIQNAESVTLQGTGVMDGEEMTVDVSGYTDDSFISGTITMGEIEMELLGDDENVYIKPNEALFEQMGGSVVSGLVGDNWIEAPAGEALTMSDIYDSLREELPAEDSYGDAEYEVETVDRDGEEVYQYSGTLEDSDEPASLYIDQDDQLVRLETTPDEGDEQVAVDFSDWNAVEKTSMPAQEEIFSVPGL